MIQINIRGLQTGGGQSMEFSHKVDLSQVTLWGQKPFLQPVSVVGQVMERGGVLMLHYQADYAPSFPCARCLAPVETPQSHTFDHILVEQAEDEENNELTVLPDGILHLEELVAADICLCLEPVVLCNPDCRGICPGCGANLNLQACTCGPQKPDNPFAKAFRNW